jgi:ornithine cyclodeaminase/alanine dehydrogenase-like protein (mu-crystallin family)
MRVFGLDEIRRVVPLAEAIDAMRDAVIAQSRGECDTPLPMHLSVGGPESEVHIKSSYRRGGDFWALKAAGSFSGRLARGQPAGSGMVFLCSAPTGDPVAMFLDEGWLTDVRTAAVAAMATRELGRRDAAIGILGTGAQARLQARLHAEILPLERVVLWGRNPAHAEACRRDVAAMLPRADVRVAASPAEVAAGALLVVTVTASRSPLLHARDLRPGALVLAVGSDSPGKQELDPEILRRASLLLVDSHAQCERLGELQHALSERDRAVELGVFCDAPRRADPGGIVIADFTGLGVEDLAIAEAAYRRLSAGAPGDAPAMTGRPGAKG